MTFNIWYRLSEYLYERNDDELNAQFKPYIERLDSLCRGSCYLNELDKFVRNLYCTITLVSLRPRKQ